MDESLLTQQMAEEIAISTRRIVREVTKGKDSRMTFEVSDSITPNHGLNRSIGGIRLQSPKGPWERRGNCPRFRRVGRPRGGGRIG